MYIKKGKLIILYARDFLLFSVCMSLISYYVYLKLGNFILTQVIWFKMITTALGIYAHQRRKSKEIFFYMNNGLGKRHLLATACILDMGFWLAGLIALINSGG